MKLKYPLNQEVIDARILEITNVLARLKKMKEISKEEFLKNSDYFAIASYNLRIALQAFLSCGSHILTRVPGAKIKEYKDTARQLGKFGIATPELTKKLVEMAGYRNRMIHFYDEIIPEEMYNILQKNIGDLEEFIKQISLFIEKQTSQNSS